MPQVERGWFEEEFEPLMRQHGFEALYYARKRRWLGPEVEVVRLGWWCGVRGSHQGQQRLLRHGSILCWLDHIPCTLMGACPTTQAL